MNRMIVVARIGIEAVLAFLCSLNVPVSGLKLLLSVGTVGTAYLVGSFVGLALELVLCILLVKDVIRLIWRLRSGPVTVETEYR